MQSLPSECVPEVGTEGDNYRRKQCFLQIPLYDFSLDASHNMTDLEKKRYGKFTDRTREKFFGVGKLKLQNTTDKKVYSTHSHVYTCTKGSCVWQAKHSAYIRSHNCYICSTFSSLYTAPFTLILN